MKLRKIGKSFLAAFLSLCIMSAALTGLTLPAAAATDASGTTGDCTWSLDGTALTVSGNGAMDNYSYNTAAPWGTEITEVIVEDGVTRIGNFAFSNCVNLENVTLPDGLTSIGEYAFCNCRSITGIQLPETVRTIEYNAFDKCVNLKSIKIPYGVTQISDSAFYECFSLESIYIPASVKTIGAMAFYDCISLETVYYCGTDAHWNEVNISNLDDNDNTYLINAARVHQHTYNGDCATQCNTCSAARTTSSSHTYASDCDIQCNVCSEMRTTSIEHTYDNEFDVKCNVCGYTRASTENAGSLLTYTVSNGNVTITDCDTVISGDVTIPSTIDGYPVTSIGNSAFNSCSSITSVIIPDSVTSIGNYAFFECGSLTNVTIGKGVTSIGASAFRNCGNLTDIDISNGVKTIGGSAFRNCVRLTNIVIPDSVTSIGDYAFRHCNSLEKITLPFIGNTLNGTTNTHFGYIFGASKYLLNDDNVPASLKEVVITKATIIDQYAFYLCSGLKTITIPDTVTEIGYKALGGCYGLTGINITDVGAWCRMVISSESPLYYANYLYLNGKLITDLVIPDGITNIRNRAFYNCYNITSVAIPDSVKTVDYDAFKYCNNLKKIYYCGTAEQWSNITINDDSSAITEAELQYHNYEWVIDKSSTCGEDGVKHEECAICHDTRSIGTVIAATQQHVYDYNNPTIVPPTEQNPGYTLYTCTVCDKGSKRIYDETYNSVQNMQVTATDTNITVTWDAIAGATKYNLYVNDAEGNNLITRALAADRTSVTLSWPSELEWDKTYTIGIRAKTTKWLDTVYKTAALTVADRIADVKTQSVGRTIKVDWRAYEGATQYYVYVYEKGKYPTAFTSVKATTNSVSIINAISPEIDYEVRVIATKGVTKMKTADALSVDARLNVFAPDSFAERSVMPNKAAVNFDEVRGADKYWIYFTAVNGGETIVKEAKKTTVAVGGLTPNTTYNVQIQARIVDADGKAHYSGKSAVLGTVTTNDWEDMGFTATAAGGGAKLSWKAPANATKYVIYRSNNGGKSYYKLITIHSPSATSYTDSYSYNKNGYIYAIVTYYKNDYFTTKSPFVKSEPIVK